MVFQTPFLVLEYEEKAPLLPNENLIKIKKSLNFNKPFNEDSNSNHSLPDPVNISEEASRKRQQDEMFGSLSDDDELCGKSKHIFHLEFPVNLPEVYLIL